MKIIKTDIHDVLLIKPKIFSDQRGDFRETYREHRYREAGIDCKFVQDNLVHSVKNVFRGLHFQLPPHEQAKLITILKGEILDVIVDLRKDSESYLKQLNIPLSAEKGEQLFIPEGFAHGYYVLSDNAIISYKVSAPYAPEHQGGIRWDEPQFKLKDLFDNPLLSEQDKTLPRLKEIL
jgi:dTDP-4-dehydrorhamnose 3,5-epimerase